ncbi:ThuA domain-containing protein [Pelagicoccus sp. SDUM812005]|uniref:ThuA domain-containing protein n=1 Tax=Pelagicoccus sp. SDUM812005 TaxID=3041257 RepID=UPI00280D7E0C|nr:ThuA domain-containing protein [Pelagicoccus sp. SDUM812005]MDQ8179575.1 ThuA domain-containing protein [Pelagicoccus sp. SDUM812005]
MSRIPRHSKYRVATARLLLALLAFPCAASSLASEATQVTLITASDPHAFIHAQQISSFTRLMRDLAYEENWKLTEIRDAKHITEDLLKQTDVLVFGYTGGKIFDKKQEADFEQYVRSGGSTIGVHSITYTEASNPFFLELVGGGKFAGHPPTQPAELIVHEGRHPSTQHLPARFKSSDEWYCYSQNPIEDADTRTLLSVDPSSYAHDGKTYGEGVTHPMTWYNQKHGGRHWFTSLGHTMILHQRGWFVDHIRGGIQWAAAEREPLAPWTSLFDGESLDGWHLRYDSEDDVSKTFVTVEDGTLLFDTTSDGKQKGIWLVSNHEYDDFELRMKIQSFSDSPGNSGIQVRSRYNDRMEGPQIDIHPPAPFRNGLIYDMTQGNQRWIQPSLPDHKVTPEQAGDPAKDYWVHAGDDTEHQTGASPRQLPVPIHLDFIEANDQETWEKGWNNIIIRCEGTRITTFVNEAMIADLDGDGILNDALHQAAHVGMRGHIAFQIHARGKLKLRVKDIRIREIGAE